MKFSHQSKSKILTMNNSRYLHAYLRASHLGAEATFQSTLRVHWRNRHLQTFICVHQVNKTQFRLTWVHKTFSLVSGQFCISVQVTLASFSSSWRRGKRINIVKLSLLIVVWLGSLYGFSWESDYLVLRHLACGSAKSNIGQLFPD